ncbi:MAG TPA: tetratricopeptide repeat protein, partial [Gammaproteobacteria bacterium]|nr:tetratricopeptide repeat protein [Gammaproteobacteria bacterium]
AGNDSDSPSTQASPPKPFNENPGEIDFGNLSANVMYEILIAELATQRGNPQIGSKFYVEAAKQSQDPRIASRAVRIATFANEKDDALAAARIWKENEPDNAEAQRVLAVLYLRNNDSEKAKRLLGKLLAKDKVGISRNLLLTGAMLQRETGKESAAKVAAYLVTLYPKQAESYYIHASLAIQAKQKTEALKSIRKALEIRPSWIDAAVLYPRILQENGKNAEALDYLSAFVKKHPSEDVLRLAYARLLVDERKLEEARKQFKLLLLKMPNNRDVLFALAMLSMQFKNFDKAEDYLNQLNTMGKASPQVLYYLGQLAEQKEDFPTAINWYSQIHDGEYFIESQLRISVILAKTKTIEAARAHLHAIKTKTDKEKEDVTIFEGNLLRDFKQYQAAYDFYSGLLAKDPENEDYLYYRSLVAEKLDLVDVVIRDLSYVISKDPENAAAINALGYTLADRTDRLEEALKLIQRAQELEPNDAAIIDSLGWVNYRLGNYALALKYLRQAMDKIEDGEVAAHLGEVLWAMGKKNEAIQVWKKAKKQFSDNEILQATLNRFGQ